MKPERKPIKEDKVYKALMSSLRVNAYILSNLGQNYIEEDELAQYAAQAIQQISEALAEFNL